MLFFYFLSVSFFSFCGVSTALFNHAFGAINHLRKTATNSVETLQPGFFSFPLEKTKRAKTKRVRGGGGTAAKRKKEEEEKTNNYPSKESNKTQEKNTRKLNVFFFFARWRVDFSFMVPCKLVRLISFSPFSLLRNIVFSETNKQTCSNWKPAHNLPCDGRRVVWPLRCFGEGARVSAAAVWFKEE